MRSFLEKIVANLPGLVKKPDSDRPEIRDGVVDPSAWAEYFARRMRARGYRLDYSLGSLDTEVDRILESNLFINYNLVVAEANLSPSNELRESPEHQRARAKYLLYAEYETGLSAYIGETLRRAWQVEWVGPFSAHAPLRNLYLSKLKLDGSFYNPSRYPSARLSGARPDAGGFRAQLDALLAKQERASA